MIVSMCIMCSGKRPERGYVFDWNPAVYGFAVKHNTDR